MGGVTATVIQVVERPKVYPPDISVLPQPTGGDPALKPSHGSADHLLKQQKHLPDIWLVTGRKAQANKLSLTLRTTGQQPEPCRLGAQRIPKCLQPPC